MASQESDHRSIWSDLRGTAFCQGWIDAGGLSTRYLHSGSTDAPALLFLHGTGGHAEAFVRNLGAHGEHFSTWAMDFVGHGWSAHPKGPLEIPDYVRHVIAFLDALGIEKVSLSGESLGGWVGAWMALEYPERLDALVLNTMGGTRANPEVMERIRSLSMAAVERPEWDFVRQRLEWLMADGSVVHDDLVATRQAIYAQPGMIEAMEHTLALQDMEVRKRNLLSEEDLGRISTPTLVLWTTHDPTADVTEAERIAAAIPSAEMTVMQDCGHWPQFEDAPTFNEIHLEFLLRQRRTGE